MEYSKWAILLLWSSRQDEIGSMNKQYIIEIIEQSFSSVYIWISSTNFGKLIMYQKFVSKPIYDFKLKHPNPDYSRDATHFLPLWILRIQAEIRKWKYVSR